MSGLSVLNILMGLFMIGVQVKDKKFDGLYTMCAVLNFWAASP